MFAKNCENWLTIKQRYCNSKRWHSYWTTAVSRYDFAKTFRPFEFGYLWSVFVYGSTVEQMRLVISLTDLTRQSCCCCGYCRKLTQRLIVIGMFAWKQSLNAIAWKRLRGPPKVSSDGLKPLSMMGWGLLTMARWQRLVRLAFPSQCFWQTAEKNRLHGRE